MLFYNKLVKRFSPLLHAVTATELNWWMHAQNFTDHTRWDMSDKFSSFLLCMYLVHALVTSSHFSTIILACEIHGFWLNFTTGCCCCLFIFIHMKLSMPRIWELWKQLRDGWTMKDQVCYLSSKLGWCWPLLARAQPCEDQQWSTSAQGPFAHY